MKTAKSISTSKQRKPRTLFLLAIVAIIGIVTLLVALGVVGGGEGSSGYYGNGRGLFVRRQSRNNGEEKDNEGDSLNGGEGHDSNGIDNSRGRKRSASLSHDNDNEGSDKKEDGDHNINNADAHADVQQASNGGGDAFSALISLDKPITANFTAYRNPFPPLNRSARRPCSGLTYTSGRWVKREGMEERYPAMGDILGCCQRGYEEENGKGAQRPETQYVWESDECDLHEWSEELFCKALRGRNIMIAGDSLNDHWHASLYYLLGGRKDIYRKEGTVRGKKACGTHAICAKYYPKPLKLYFLTNQLLEEERRPFRNYKWWKHIHQYPILILNSGSWMRDPQDERREVSDEEYFRHMEKALRIVKRQNFTGTLIWRTTYQGHPYCWNYEEPLTEELKDEDFPRVAPYLRYRWWAIPHRNNYTVNMWRNAGAHILDVRRITNLMPLGHLGRFHPKNKERNVTDCLHYCSPGPVYDTWSMLLMNLLAGNIDG